MPVDLSSRLIMVSGIVAGLCCLAVVIAAGLMTALAVWEGLMQVPVASPIPMQEQLSRQPIFTLQSMDGAPVNRQ